MTQDNPTPTDGGNGIHRLVDMVVEEVSLVDRAANNHRFLLVKRDDAMDLNAPNPPSDPADKAAPTADPALDIADDSPLGTALAALESLTAIVELLGSLGADSNDMRLAALAQQLRATAEQLLARSGFADPAEASDTPTSDVQAKAKARAAVLTTSTASAAIAPLTVDLNAAKAAITRLAQLASKALPAPGDKPAPPGQPAATESLAKLADSLRELAEAVNGQQQRLGRVEKQVGLPNSIAPAEVIAASAEEDVGWPLDLNQPKDRESVDKTVSFHDL